MPKISIVVPVYNVEQQLNSCIDSILAQTFEDFELILVDDGSTDKCGSICDRYAKKDTRIKVMHKENEGVSVARNIALAEVSGTYLAFCDSDDCLAPDWLEQMYFAMITNNADVVVGSYIKVFEDGRENKKIIHETGQYKTSEPEEKIRYIFYQIFGQKHGWEVWSRLFKVDIVKKNNSCFCETCGNFAEDLGFVLEYSLYANHIVSIPLEGYYYRVRIGSMMNSSINSVKLDSVNEISLNFMKAYKKALGNYRIATILPIFHFLIMHNQYFKITGSKDYPKLGQMTNSIKNYEEWKKYTKQIRRCDKELKSYFGSYNSKRILLLSHYCIHGNWNRFKFESFLLYKFNKPR